MPEQITKYPEVTLKVLEGAGAACGQGAPQKILTQCPRDRFCSLPTGEICVYGIKDIPKMTQISARDLAQLVCPVTQEDVVVSAGLLASDGISLIATFLVGLAVGLAWKRFRDHVAARHKDHET
jgi:hypothetical protein